MKVVVKAVLLVLAVGVLVVLWLGRGSDDLAVDSEDNRPNVWTFGRYYKPYKVKIGPDAPDYRLPLDLSSIVNVSDIESVMDFDSVSILIRQNGFAVTDLKPHSLLRPSAYDDIVDAYRLLRLGDVPLFMSVDAGLYLYHALFDEILRDIEENVFIADINNLTIALLEDAVEQYGQLEGDVQEAAKRNIAYLAVGNNW